MSKVIKYIYWDHLLQELQREEAACNSLLSLAAYLEPESQLAGGPELRSKRHPNELRSAQALLNHVTNGLPCLKSLKTSVTRAEGESTPELTETTDAQKGAVP